MNQAKKTLGLADNWQEGDIIANSIRLHYYRTGGNKPPLVLAHGLSDNGLCWGRVAQVLQADFDVIMVDARGHGRSDKPMTGYSSIEHAADLADFIRNLNLGTTAVVGHSMGAATALHVAAQQPHLISRLILEDPPLYDHDPQTNQHADIFAYRDMLVNQIQPQPIEAIIRFAQQTNTDWDAGEFPAWAESKKQVAPQAFDYVVARSENWRDIVRQITIPTLLVTADTAPRPSGSAIVTPEIANEISTLNPHIQIAHIPNAGHNIRREQYENYMDVIRPLLQR